MKKEKNWDPITQTLICDCGIIHKRVMKWLGGRNTRSMVKNGGD
jgi:hypothetical protein